MTSNASLLLSNRLKFRWPTVAGPPFLQTFRAELSWFYWALVSYVRIQILLHNVIPTLQGILCAYVTISGLWGRTHLNIFRSLHVQLRMLKFCPCYHDAKMSRASSCHFLNVHLQEWGIKDTRRSTAVQAHFREQTLSLVWCNTMLSTLLLLLSIFAPAGMTHHHGGCLPDFHSQNLERTLEVASFANHCL